MSDDELTLRRMLWLRHGCLGLYGDDGEMQCGTCMIDFKRMEPALIEARFRDIGMQKLLDAQAASKTTSPDPMWGVALKGEK